MKLLKDNYFFDDRWTAVMMQDFLHAIGFKEVEIHFGQNFHGEQGWFCDSVAETDFTEEINEFHTNVVCTAASKPSLDADKIFSKAVDKACFLHKNNIESWRQSTRPIFYIDHTDECYCSLLFENILKKAEAGIKTDEHCYIGVVDFKEEVKKRFSCFEDVADLIADQLGECTEDKVLDACLYNSVWNTLFNDKEVTLNQIKNIDPPSDIDFKRYRNFYAWKTGDNPIFFTDNDGACWASDNLDWIKNICIHDINNGADFVELHIQNYDKEARLKFQDYADICGLEAQTPTSDILIFDAKFTEKCDEDMPLMSREDAISRIKELTPDA